MPDPGPPILQIDVSQPGMGTHDNLDRPAVQPRGAGTGGAGGFGQERRLGPFLQDHERVAEVHRRKRGQVQFVRSTRGAVPANWTCPLFRRGQRRQDMERLVDQDAPRHVKQRPAGPRRRVKGRELIGPRIDDPRGHVGPQQIPVLDDQLVQAAEEHAADAPLRLQPRIDRMAVQGHCLSGQLHVLRQKCPRDRGVCRGRPGQAEAVQAQQADVRAAPLLLPHVRQRRRLERLPRRPTHFGQPIRLAAGGEEILERRPGEAGLDNWWTRDRHENDIRNTKHEIRNKCQLQKLKIQNPAVAGCGVSRVLSVIKTFVIPVCFGFRASDFGFPNLRFLPSAVGSGGSFRRRIPSAAPSPAAR